MTLPGCNMQSCGAHWHQAACLTEIAPLRSAARMRPAACCSSGKIVAQCAPRGVVVGLSCCLAMLQSEQLYAAGPCVCFCLRTPWLLMSNHACLQSTVRSGSSHSKSMSELHLTGLLVAGR